jgi:hypothetical protein
VLSRESNCAENVQQIGASVVLLGDVNGKADEVTDMKEMKPQGGGR